MLEKDGEDQLNRSCEKLRSDTESPGGGDILHAVKSRKANWIGHILCRNCLQKHIIEGKIRGRI